MKWLNRFVLIAGALLLSPPSTAAQEVPLTTLDATGDPNPALVGPNSGPVLPRPVKFVRYVGPELSPQPAARSDLLAAPVIQGQDGWPGWVKPAIFIGGGALVGAAYGTYVMVEADDGWMSWPAHVVTVPIGMAAGAVLAFFFS